MLQRQLNVFYHRFDDFEAGNGYSESVRAFASLRILVVYSAFNWYEHVMCAGASGAELLKDRYSTILDISKSPFWVWFLVVSDHIFTNLAGKFNDPISKVWAEKESGNLAQSDDFGSFLRNGCLRQMFTMDEQVSNLFGEHSEVGSERL